MWPVHNGSDRSPNLNSKCSMNIAYQTAVADLEGDPGVQRNPPFASLM